VTYLRVELAIKKNRFIIKSYLLYDEFVYTIMFEFVWFLIIGLIAGWLAGKIMKGSGYGLIGDLVIGVIGAFIGGFLFGLVGLSANGFIASLIAAVVGAIVLIFIVGLIKKK
jgi:uncharacterized membrane protein YeaQ/YmgE (transglycosylase-associated protein family)